MFKNRIVARRVCLMAGVDCTLPLTLSSLMRGYKPEDTEVELNLPPNHMVKGSKHDNA